MKNLLLTILMVLPNIAIGQDYGNNAETLKLCTTLQTNSFSSNLDADSALDRILEVVGLSKNFVLAPCSDINNAVAVSFKGVRYILYDPEFMSMLSRNTSNWTNLFILAHEVGHHVNGHSLDLVLYAGEIVDAPELKKKREQELEADEFAGFVLAKLGASLNQTTSSVSKLSNEDDTYSTHPKRDRRISSIKKGWEKGYIKEKVANQNDNIESSLKNLISFGWDYKLLTPPKNPNNPFDKLNKSKKLTSTATASCLVDKRKSWSQFYKYSNMSIPERFSESTEIKFPNLEVIQTIDADGYKTIEVYLNNYIDLDFVHRLIPNHYSSKRFYADLSVYIDDTEYKFRLADPDLTTDSFIVLPEKNEYGTKGEWEKKLRLYIFSDKYGWNYSFKGQDGKSYAYTQPGFRAESVHFHSFINHLKSGKSLFFKLTSILNQYETTLFDCYECYKNIKIYDYGHKHTDLDEDWFNTYFIDLKGSSKALSF